MNAEREKWFITERYRHWVNDHVRFSDLDALGHVNNNAMGTYFENARANIFSIVTPRWPWRDTIFVLVHTSIDFVHELNLPSHLKIGSCVTRIGRTSLGIASALYNEDGPIAYSEAVSSLIDNEERVPVPISDELRAALQPFLDGTP